MKKKKLLIRVVLPFIFLCSFLRSYTQSPPSDYVVNINYQLQTHSITGLPAAVDLENPVAFQLSRYQKRSSTKQYNIYMGQTGQFYTEIDYINTDNTQADWMTPIGKVVIDSAGTTIYDPQGRAREYVEHSAKYQSYNMLLGLLSSMNPQQLGVFPFPSNLSAEQISNYESKGYFVEVEGDSSYRLTQAGQKIVVDAAVGSYQIQGYNEAGSLQISEQYLFQPNANMQWLPFQTLKTVYRTDAQGHCSTRMEMLRYSNYSITPGNSSPRNQKVPPALLQQKLEVFPNPGKDILNLKFPSTGKIKPDWHIEVFDLLGKKMETFTLESNLGSIDISTLTKGVYLLKAHNGEKVFSHLFSKF